MVSRLFFSSIKITKVNFFGGGVGGRVVVDGVMCELNIVQYLNTIFD